MDDHAVIVGAVGKPVGLHGDVYVHADPDIDDGFPAGTRYHTDQRVLTVASSRLHGGRRVVRFEEVADREDAASLRGAVLQVPRADIALEEGAAWVGDVLGSDVFDDEGQLIGVLERILDAPAHDLLVIARPDGGEVLVPAVEDLVELGPDALVVHAIPGLLDPDAADEG